MRLRHLGPLLWVAIVFAQSPSAPAQSSNLVANGGSVVSLKESPIVSAKVEFAGRAGKFVTETELDGTYKIRLPQGKFVLTISAKGFCSRMDNVLIGATIHVPRTFALMECSDCPPMNVDFDPPSIGLEEHPPEVPDFSKLPSMKYQTEKLSIPGPANSKLSMIFGKRTEADDSSTYIGLFCPGHDKPPVLSYPGGTISARKFVYSREGHIMKGEGDVVLLDSNGISKGTIIEINLLNGSPKVTLQK